MHTSKRLGTRIMDFFCFRKLRKMLPIWETDYLAAKELTEQFEYCASPATGR